MTGSCEVAPGDGRADADPGLQLRLLDPPDSGFLTLPSPLPDDVTPPESGDPVRVSLASISTPGRYGARAPPPQLARGRGGRGRESAEGELLTFRVGR